MKKIYLLFCLFGSVQSFSQTGIFLQEPQLSINQGSQAIQDPTAYGGTAIQRLQGTPNIPNTTMWYGPYIPFKAGDYILQFRMKVSANTNTNPIVNIDANSNTGGGVFASFLVTPAMFSKPNVWQVFTLTMHVPQDVSDMEIRGMDFNNQLQTDLYVDYVNILTQNVITTNLSGNVAIGVPNSDTKGYKLGVNGDAIFNRVVVKQYPNWADYVFEENYPLRSLHDLEQYIQQNGHLPEVPSAKQVEKTGLEVGENQVLLLKKIEELTLYIINQNKRLEACEMELKELKKGK
ncbi:MULTISPECIES: hypothetical protein [Niastella]|uniref:Uncharacterized protein n=1 Tax=Niastella soli TaxID=2821487 RepID=A0ABS3YV07_9BACT|nr:hypothetical protein [Niastella soli]MBO9201766.1 hypothetical protein [Niastella soli]